MQLDTPNTKSANLYTVKVPYSTKLLTQELESMNIGMRFVLEDSPKMVPIKLDKQEFKPQVKKLKVKKSKHKIVSLDSVKTDISKPSLNEGKLTQKEFDDHFNTPLTLEETNNFLQKCLKQDIETLKNIYSKVSVSITVLVLVL